MDKDGSSITPGNSVSLDSDDEQRPDNNSKARGGDTAAAAVFSFASRRAMTESAAQAPVKSANVAPLEAPLEAPQKVAPEPAKTPGKGPGNCTGPGKKPGKPNQNANKKKAKQPPAPQMPVKPIAKPAVMRRRHWGILTSFLFVVLIPFAAIVSYLFFVAQPQYHSLTGFTVRSQEESGANDLLGGLAQLAGGSTASDNDILYEFIRSQGMVERVNETVDLRAHYSQHWPNDWFYSIWDDATKEDLIWFWNRVVGVSYDQGTGLIEVQVTAFDPATAQALTQAIVDVSHEQINELNLAARNEAMQYAMTDLEEALERLKNAREALTAYRTQSQIVDPSLDLQTRMGVMTSLQQELATALVDYDLLLGSTATGDPRLRDTEQRIEVIRDRIAIERQNLSTSSTETGGVDEDYPTLLAEFERLTTDREFAEQVYFASLQAVEIARDEANRSSRYLATYINPTRADTSEYPRVLVLSALSFLFLMLAWSIGTLIYYSIRDRS